MPKKQHRGKSHQVKELAQALVNNGLAQQSQQKKVWTVHDLTRIYPKTANQNKAFNAFDEFDHVALDGSAGTGKSLLALYHALRAVIVDKVQDRIIIIRSAVPVRDQGFLPGSIDEKNQAYESPYYSLYYELLSRASSYEDMKKAGIVEFYTTGYMRGVTLDNSIIIVEEAQNMTIDELRTVITRTGLNSRVFITADNKQKDLKSSGYERALRIIDRIDSFTTITFGHDDILRSELVKQWLIAEESL